MAIKKTVGGTQHIEKAGAVGTDIRRTVGCPRGDHLASRIKRSDRFNCSHFRHRRLRQCSSTTVALSMVGSASQSSRRQGSRLDGLPTIKATATLYVNRIARSVDGRHIHLHPPSRPPALQTHRQCGPRPCSPPYCDC